MKKKYKLISSLLIIILMSYCLLTGAQAKSRNYSGNIKNVLNEKEVYDRVCEIYKACNSAFITKDFIITLLNLYILLNPYLKYNNI